MRHRDTGAGAELPRSELLGPGCRHQLLSWLIPQTRPRTQEGRKHEVVPINIAMQMHCSSHVRRLIGRQPCPVLFRVEGMFATVRATRLVSHLRLHGNRQTLTLILLAGPPTSSCLAYA